MKISSEHSRDGTNSTKRSSDPSKTISSPHSKREDTQPTLLSISPKNDSSSSEYEDDIVKPRIRSEIRLAHPPESESQVKDDTKERKNPVKDVPKSYSLDNQLSKQSEFELLVQ